MLGCQEQVRSPGVTEHFEFQHQLHKLIVKWDPSVLAVLTYHRRNEYRLILQLDIPHSYLHELDGPDHRVILEVAGQQEPLISLPEMCGHTLHVWYRQWLWRRNSVLCALHGVCGFHIY